MEKMELKQLEYIVENSRGEKYNKATEKCILHSQH